MFIKKWTVSKEILLIIVWHPRSEFSKLARRFYVYMQMNFKCLWVEWLVFVIRYKSIDTEIGEYFSKCTVPQRANSVSCEVATKLLNKKINASPVIPKLGSCSSVKWLFELPINFKRHRLNLRQEFMQDPEESSSFPNDPYMNNKHNSCDQGVILGSPYGGRIDIFMLITLKHYISFHTRSSWSVLRKGSKER
jgi:hypothetical protein